MNNKINKVLNDRSLMRVAWKSANQFKSCLNEEELNTCILHAIWRSLTNYDEDDENAASFSTYLYRGVTIECLSYRKSNILKKMYPTGSNLRLGTTYKTQDDVDMMEEISMCDDPQIIYDRFYKSMTLNEIAKERGVSRETIRTKIKKNVQILKKRMAYSV